MDVGREGGEVEGCRDGSGEAGQQGRARDREWVVHGGTWSVIDGVVSATGAS